MLVIEENARDRFREMVAHAKKYRLVPQLCRQLECLGMFYCLPRDRSLARCRLGPDFAPLSLTFAVESKDQEGNFRFRVNGGLIYAGPTSDGGEVRLDGSFPALTVGFGTPRIGWSIHT